MTAFVVLILFTVTSVTAFQVDATPCDPNPCRHGGTCIDLDYGKFRCKCRPGFTGQFCRTQLDVCPDDFDCNCGACILGPSGFRCKCFTDWSGPRCQTSPCNNGKLRCKNRGICEQVGNCRVRCRCGPTSSGRLCETKLDVCPDDFDCNCGACILGSSGYLCKCLTDWSGPRCQTSPCNNGKFRCKNRGICERVGKCRVRCRCGPTSTGRLCETKLDVCPDRPICVCGHCQDALNGYTCKCSNGWTGSNCEIDPCQNGKLKCENGAICLTLGRCHGARCRCRPDFTGKQCQTKIDNCKDKPCKCGDCIDGINSFTCECKAGWSGLKCDEGDPCDPNPCRNHGTCALDGCDVRCTCGKWRKGAFCQEYV